MLLGKNFDAIDGDTIKGLIDVEAPESIHLEFKQQPYGKPDNDKKELLKDVSAFANTLGGHLIIGIAEKNGVAEKIMPIPKGDADSELGRIEQILGAGVEPALLGVRLKAVEVEEGVVLVLQVPRSYNPPHRVTFRNSNRYYGRGATRVDELSLEELRQLFGERRSLEERAAAFVRERFLRVQADDGFAPLYQGEGGWVIHLVPLPDFGADRRFAVEELKEQRFDFSPIGAGSFEARVNLEGIVNLLSGPTVHGYTQIFRNGAVEAVQLDFSANESGEKFIRPRSWARQLLCGVRKYMSGLQALGASAPVLLQVSAFGVAGLQWLEAEGGGDDIRVSLRSDALHLPASIISDIISEESRSAAVAEQMHSLWNAFGRDRCPLFDEAGQWVDRSR